MSELSLATCPICHAQDSLSRETMERAGRPFTWYECRECGSVLLWMGEDRWAYQKLGREEKSHLLKQPLTLDDLQALLAQAEEDVHAVPIMDDAVERVGEPDTNRPVARRLIPLLLALCLIGFVAFAGAAVYQTGLLAALFPTATPAVTPSLRPEMQVYLADRGHEVTLWPMEGGDCRFRVGAIQAPTGERATILNGLCYREGAHDYFYEVEAKGVVGWVREDYIIPVDVYTPVPTLTPLPTVAPGGRSRAASPVKQCVKPGSGITYVIEGRGVSQVSLTWENDTGGTNQGEFIVPFCKTFTGFRSGDFLYISAQIVKGEGSIRCHIYDGMTIIAQADASGFASIATCRGSAR